MAEARASTPLPAQDSAEPEMSRRSWYTTTTAIDAFAQAVDDLHHATRVPKHAVVAALMEAAVTHKADVYHQLMERHPLNPPAT
ncbi:hypothetical protein ACGFX2_39665 [Streptomyces goshikiensis]|uniref:hypothetical protein n=1 Tax=Streptomyces goshikiensis TaxID=1942 RepID=UPI00372095C9